MRQIPYKGTNEDFQGEDNTNNTLRTNLNKPAYGLTSRRQITLVSYDSAINILIKSILTHGQTSRR